MKRIKNAILGWIDYQTFLHFSLVFVLVASLRHVAYAFSTLESNTGQCTVLVFWVADNCSLFWGYFQAIAIDLVIVALAYGIRTRSESGQGVRWYWVGVVTFTAISTYANLLYGLVFSGQVPPSADWPRLSQMMVYAKPFLLSGVLPLMLIYISHITAYAGRGVVRLADVSLPYRERVQRTWAEAIAGEWRGLGIPPAGWLHAEYEARIGERLPHSVADEVALARWGGAPPALPEPVDAPPVSRMEAELSGGEVERLLATVAQADAVGPEHRRLVGLLRDQGLSWPEVAERCGRGVTTVQRWGRVEVNGMGK